MYDGPGTYRHYKGGIYQVQGLGRLEEDHHEARVVIYAPIDGWPENVHPADYWIRPLRKFDEYVNGAPRFEKLPPEEQCDPLTAAHDQGREYGTPAAVKGNMSGAPGHRFGD